MTLPERGKHLATRDIHRVVILGGTHGNERVGVHVVQYVEAHRDEFRTGTVREIETLIGNPRAVERNSRYIDRDLNRCYAYDYDRPLREAEAKKLEDDATDYEVARALEVRRTLGALGEPLPFLIDLHGTTSNMGNCLIITDEDPWMLHFCDRLGALTDNTHVLVYPGPRREDEYTSSLALNHLTLEVGPAGQGVAHVPTIESTRAIVRNAIRVIDELNGDQAAARSAEGLRLTLYRIADFSVDYPRDHRGFPAAFLHERLLGRDFEPLARGMPLFRTLQGETLPLEPSSHVPPVLIERLERGDTLVPIFVGEAAYVEKGVAFQIAERVSLPSA